MGSNSSTSNSTGVKNSSPDSSSTGYSNFLSYGENENSKGSSNSKNLNCSPYSSSTEYSKDSSTSDSPNNFKIKDNFININCEQLIHQKKNNDSTQWINNIVKKILDEKKNNPNILEEIKKIYGLDLKDFAFALGDEKVFKETFLLPKYRPFKIINEINKDLFHLKNLGENITEQTEQILENTINKLNERKTNLCQTKLELILTQCDASDQNFLFRKFINTIYEFGVLHSAISLDGTIIEWGRGPCGQNLVCPNLDIKRFLFAIEIKAKEDKNFFRSLLNIIGKAITFIIDAITFGKFGIWILGIANDDKLDKIAKICVLFNKYQYYNCRTNNCQHFVKKILKAIESDFTFEGEFGKIIKKLENEGKIDFIFKNKTFNTRKELDKYVKSIDFSSLSKNDKKLLI